MTVPIWKEPARGSFMDSSALKWTGLELGRAAVSGDLPRSPLAHLTGWEATEVGPGIGTFYMPASPWFISPAGAFFSGILAIVADGALPMAIQTTLPPGVLVSTTDMTLNFLRPATPESQALIARGRLTHGTRSAAVSEVHLEDGRGRHLAHGTSRCMLIKIDPSQFGDASGPAPEEVYDTPDPYLRPVQGEVLDEATFNELTGSEILRGQIKGELPMPPAAHLFGIRYTDVSDQGSFTLVMPSTQWCCTPKGTMSGGVIAMTAFVGSANAVLATVEKNTAFAPVHLDVTFVRPVLPDGKDLVIRGRVLHRGKTMAASAAEVFNSEGKLVAVANASALIYPGRPITDMYPIAAARAAIMKSRDRGIV